MVAVGVGYSPSGWRGVVVATAGASAALTGLLMVAVSVKIEQIPALVGAVSIFAAAGGGLYWIVA